MARKPNGKEEFVNFNVTYEDGSVTSNRRVPQSVVDSLDGEVAILAALAAQDADIAERSGRPRGPIKSIARVKGR
ncbi:MAG: hypothetical protein R3D27_05105 [Hyphomicrobiaceae bacterium]